MRKPTGAAVARYIETLTLAGGDRDGERFRVLPWERRFLSGAFRQPKDSALSIARGNGKSALVAAIATAVVDPDGPLHGTRFEVDVVASAFGQARVIFEDVRGFLETKYGAEFPRLFRKLDSQSQAMIEHRASGARIRCLGSDPQRAHGLRPALVLADEPAAWEGSRADRMIAALRTGLGKVPGSRLIALGTRPAGEGHFFAKMLREAGYAQSHAAAPDAPPFRLATIRRANPSWAHLPSLRARVLRERDEAKRDAAALASFRALRLNQGTSDTDRAMLLEAATWKAAEGKAERRGGYVLGLDLGGSAAMSAAAAFYPETGALEAVAAFPGIPGLGERGLRDGVGGLYGEMEGRGELFQIGRRTVPVPEFVARVFARWGAPAAIATDRWRADELADALEAAKVRARIVERGQGFKDGSEDVRAFRREILEDRVVPAPSLLLRSAMAEAVTMADPAGNEKLCKASEGGRRKRGRDDAAAAAILAVAEGSRRRGRMRPRKVSGFLL